MATETSPPVDSSALVPEIQKKQGKNSWLSWLLALGLVSGITYLAYRQVVVVSSQEAKRRVLTQPVARKTLPMMISANGTVKPERLINEGTNRPDAEFAEK
jgi:HlyD family secretion protein